MTDSPPLRRFNLVLVTLCVSCLVFATVTIIVWIWGEDLGATMGRVLSTIGLVLVSSLLGLIVNSIVGRHLVSFLSRICWGASWACILIGTVVGCIAIWLHTREDEILLKTLGTIIVLFLSSTVGTALAGSLAGPAGRD